MSWSRKFENHLLEPTILALLPFKPWDFFVSRIQNFIALFF
jgi:hypothetical protein